MLVVVIRAIHAIIIVLLAISPFISNAKYKVYALTFLLYLAFQYISGYQRCGLTELEYMILGEKYDSGFLYRIINPLITVDESYFDNYLHIIHACYIAMLLPC
jgi:hypothetical protein